MENSRNYVPQLASIAFISIIIGLTAYTVLSNAFTPGMKLFVAFIGLYLLWLGLEFKTAKSETQKGKNTADFGTCEIYSLGRAFTLITGIIFFQQRGAITDFHIAGIILFVTGFSFRLYAIHTLGRYYSHIVRKVDGHQIITSGPYGVVRHPAYTGMILANVGVTVFFFNYVTLGVFALILIPSIVARIFIEEKMLFDIQGYKDYAHSRKRIIPFIW